MFRRPDVTLDDPEYLLGQRSFLLIMHGLHDSDHALVLFCEPKLISQPVAI